MFRVELFRNLFPMMEESRGIGEASEKHRRNIGEVSGIEKQIELNDTQQKILNCFWKIINYQLLNWLIE